MSQHDISRPVARTTAVVPRGITITSLALLSWGLVAALTYILWL